MFLPSTCSSTNKSIKLICLTFLIFLSWFWGSLSLCLLLNLLKILLLRLCLHLFEEEIVDCDDVDVLRRTQGVSAVSKGTTIIIIGLYFLQRAVLIDWRNEKVSIFSWRRRGNFGCRATSRFMGLTHRWLECDTLLKLLFLRNFLRKLCLKLRYLLLQWVHNLGVLGLLFFHSVLKLSTIVFELLQAQVLQRLEPGYLWTVLFELFPFVVYLLLPLDFETVWEELALLLELFAEWNLHLAFFSLYFQLDFTLHLVAQSLFQFLLNLTTDHLAVKLIQNLLCQKSTLFLIFTSHLLFHLPPDLPFELLFIGLHSTLPLL